MDKILFFCHYPSSKGLYGADRILMTVAENVSNDKFKKIVVSPARGAVSEYLQKAQIEERIISYDCNMYNQMVYHAKSTDELDGICDNFEAILKKSQLYAFFKEWKPDIVYANTILSICAAVLGKMIGAKVVWHIHEINENILMKPDEENLNEIVARYSDKVIVVSKAVKKALKRTGQLEKCELVYNGIEAPGLSAEQVLEKRAVIRRHIGLNSQQPLIAYLGRIEPTKGIERFILAANLVLKVEPNARFVIIGEPTMAPDYTARLKDLIYRLGRGKEIKFGGYCNNLDTTIPAIDCLVVPSIQKESLPTVVIEANLYRRPVVAFRQGGIGEIIIHGKNGFLVEDNNIKHMAAAIYTIIKNQELAINMGEYGYKRAIHKFNCNNYVKNMTTILDEVARGYYQANPFREGNVVKANSSPIYYIENATKRLVKDYEVLSRMGLDMSDIQFVPKAALLSMPGGDPIE